MFQNVVCELATIFPRPQRVKRTFGEISFGRTLFLNLQIVVNFCSEFQNDVTSEIHL